MYLRAGWSLGSTRDVYLFQERGSDQLCGRTVAGLDQFTEDFGILAPHFYTPEGITMSLDICKIMWPHHDRYPSDFQLILPVLLANLVYHAKYLQATLPADRAIFQTFLFRTPGVIDSLLPHITTDPKKTRHMTPTGVPPSVFYMSELTKVYL